jgi:hypothetical protein
VLLVEIELVEIELFGRNAKQSPLIPPFAGLPRARISPYTALAINVRPRLVPALLFPCFSIS